MHLNFMEFHRISIFCYTISFFLGNTKTHMFMKKSTFCHNKPQRRSLWMQLPMLWRTQKLTEWTPRYPLASDPRRYRPPGAHFYIGTRARAPNFGAPGKSRFFIQNTQFVGFLLLFRVVGNCFFSAKSSFFLEMHLKFIDVHRNAPQFYGIS